MPPMVGIGLQGSFQNMIGTNSKRSLMLRRACSPVEASLSRWMQLLHHLQKPVINFFLVAKGRQPSRYSLWIVVSKASTVSCENR